MKDLMKSKVLTIIQLSPPDGGSGAGYTLYYTFCYTLNYTFCYTGQGNQMSGPSTEYVFCRVRPDGWMVILHVTSFLSFMQVLIISIIVYKCSIIISGDILFMQLSISASNDCFTMFSVLVVRMLSSIVTALMSSHIADRCLISFCCISICCDNYQIAISFSFIYIDTFLSCFSFSVVSFFSSLISSLRSACFFSLTLKQQPMSCQGSSPSMSSSLRSLNSFFMNVISLSITFSCSFISPFCLAISWSLFFCCYWQKDCDLTDSYLASSKPCPSFLLFLLSAFSLLLSPLYSSLIQPSLYCLGCLSCLEDKPSLYQSLSSLDLQPSYLQCLVLPLLTIQFCSPPSSSYSNTYQYSDTYSPCQPPSFLIFFSTRRLAIFLFSPIQLSVKQGWFLCSSFMAR